MKRFQSALIIIGALALIAAGVVAVFLRDEAPESASPESTEKPVLMMKTKGVEKSITDRLSATTGRKVVAECPDEVEQTVGTKFDCDVWFEDDKDTRTVAKVKMTGGGGKFNWKTVDSKDLKDNDADSEAP